jgi:diguanylate cyclase (GGDEF)-like protein
MLDAHLLESIFRDSTDLVVLLQPDRRVRAANPAFRGLVAGARVGADFMDLVVAEGRAGVLRELVKAAGGAEVLILVPHPRADGAAGTVEYRFFPVEGGMVAGIGRLRPTDQEIGAELGRAHQALIDPVTGVWNRLQVIERLTAEWSRSERYGSPITCLLVDVESLETARRKEGTAFADEVLKVVARRIKTVVRDHDVVGRYAGDCFVIVAVHSDAEGAKALARRIRERLAAEPVAVGQRTVEVHLRIGGATNRSEGVEILEDLFAVAESALHDARSEALPLKLADEAAR